MRPLVFHPAAETEVDEAAAFYETRRRGLGRSLRQDLEQTLRRTGSHPDMAPRFEETVYRFHVLNRFPYVLFYEILSGRDHILAFAHGRRRPRYWIDRGRTG